MNYQTTQIQRTVTYLLPPKLETNQNLDFIKKNNQLLLQRLRIISITLIIVSFYYVFADVFLLNDVLDTTYTYRLYILHFLTFFVSAIYLYLYRFILTKVTNPTFIILLYSSIYALLGAMTSINSQRLTGNIDAYVYIMIGVAALLPVRPLYLFFLFSSTHLLFITGLSITVDDNLSFITKQINATTSVIIAFLVALAFFRFRKTAYLNQTRLQEKEEDFRKLFNVNPYPLILTSVTGKIMKTNHRAMEFYQVSKEELHTLRAVDFYQNKEERLNIIKELRKNGHVKNYIMEHKIGRSETKWVLLNLELIDYENNPCILAGVTDITDLKKMEEELTKHASIDALTGVMNRRSGLEQLKMKYEGHLSFVLCFIDVNNLKDVNDTYGHSEGDRLIKTTCHHITSNLNKEDILFRYGGDEFVIIFLEKKLSEVKQIWENIENVLSSVQALHTNPYPIAVSHGLYEYEPDMEISIEDLIHLADQEMYKKKMKMKQLTT